MYCNLFFQKLGNHTEVQGIPVNLIEISWLWFFTFNFIPFVLSLFLWAHAYLSVLEYLGNIGLRLVKSEIWCAVVRYWQSAMVHIKLGWFMQTFLAFSFYFILSYSSCACWKVETPSKIWLLFLVCFTFMDDCWSGTEAITNYACFSNLKRHLTQALSSIVG